MTKIHKIRFLNLDPSFLQPLNRKYGYWYFHVYVLIIWSALTFTCKFRRTLKNASDYHLSAALPGCMEYTVIPSGGPPSTVRPTPLWSPHRETSTVSTWQIWLLMTTEVAAEEMDTKYRKNQIMKWMFRMSKTLKVSCACI